MADMRRMVGSDRYNVQPIQQQAPIKGNDIVVDALLKGASERSVYGYNALQAGVENLAKLTNQTTQNAIARNDASTKLAITQAQTAGRGQEKFAQELNNINQLMQRWDASSQQKSQNKQQAARQEKEDYLRERAYIDSRVDEADNDFFRDNKFATEQKMYVDNITREDLKESIKKEAMQAYEKQEAKFDEQKQLAWTEIQDLRVTIKPMAYAENPGYVRNKIQEITSKYDLRQKDIIEITGGAYTDLKSVTDEQLGKRQDTSDKFQTHLQSQRKAQLGIVTSGIISRIKTDSSGNTQPLLDELNGTITGFFQENPAINAFDVVELYSGVLGEASKATTLSADARETINAQMNSNTAFLNEMGSVFEAFGSGEIGINQFKQQRYQLSTKYGIPMDAAADLVDPNAEEKYLVEVQTSKAKLRELQDAGQLTDVLASTINNQAIGSLTLYYVNNPDLYNVVVNGKSNFKNDPTFLRVQGVKVEYEKFTKLKTETKRQVADIDRMQAAFAEDTLAASKKTPEDSNEFKTEITQKIKVYLNGSVDLGEFTAEQQASWAAIRTAGNAAFDRKRAALIEDYGQAQEVMKQYGLENGQTSQNYSKAKVDGIVGQINSVYQQARPQGGQAPGTTPNFNGGKPSPTATQYARAEYKGKPIITPFKAGTAIQLGDGHGDAGSGNHNRQRPHGGLDIAVKNGTPLVATGTGVVVSAQWENPNNKQQGYGFYVDIKYDDGSLQRYAHMSGAFANAGQRVQAGQVFGKSGSTGRSSGPHLHWEFRRESGGGFGATLDPISHANGLLSTVGTIRPRDDNTRWGSEYNPYGGTSQRNLKTVLPKNAHPLWGGAYILNGQVVDMPSGQGKPVEQAYNKKNVLQNTAMPRTKAGFRADRDNNPAQNFHYAALAKDNEFRKAVHGVASMLNVPAVWLADVMAFETGGSFNPAIDNGVGYTGLVQFGDAAAKDLGTTRAALGKMSRAKQMEYVGKYYKMQMKYAGLKSIDNIETMLALVWGGANLAKKFAKDPDSVKNTSDGNIKFYEYLGRLGSHGGRQYETSYTTRRNNVASVVHDSYNDGCSICNQLVASNSKIVPHEAQHYG